MKKILLVLVASFSFLSAQTHIVPEGFSGISVSFKHDQNVDFFGEGKFLRDSYENAIGFGYIYNGTVGIDLAYGYSLNNKKDVYNFNLPDGDSSSENENFNFVENFRSENANVGDKTFSFGLTYYLNESQTLFEQNLPINLSLGLRYGTKNYSSDALKFLNQDFYFIMKYNKLGNTNIDVSLICLGTMTWGEQNSEEEGFQPVSYTHLTLPTILRV